jgi:hypothetical protein
MTRHIKDWCYHSGEYSSGFLLMSNTKSALKTSVFLCPSFYTFILQSVESWKLSDLTASQEILSLLVSHMFIFSGTNFSGDSTPELPLSCYNGNTYAEEVLVLRSGGKVKGLRLNLSLEGKLSF